MTDNSLNNPQFEPDERAPATPPSGPDPSSPARPPSPEAGSTIDRFREAARAKQEQDEEQEEDLWQGSYSSKAMIGKWVLAAFVTLVLLIGVLVFGFANVFLWLAWLCVTVLMWGGLWLYLLYRQLTCKYQLTTQRFLHEAGLLKRVTDRIEVIDIDDVSFEQRVVERMLGVGSIKITSSDRSHPELWLHGIEKVKEVAGLIDDIRRKERRRRGLHIEAV
jgi:uncharacterized membrane protein YdbT with pleckstrin-like domain